MKVLNGSELAGYIKERQAKQVRSLKQSLRVAPRLAIVKTSDSPVVETYMRLKKKYGADIGVEVDVYHLKQSELSKKISDLNSDEQVSGIIVQLPLLDTSKHEEMLNLVSPTKDVDGLCESSVYDPATALAILWLLDGYNIDLNTKKILLVGRGKLVGEPLERLMEQSKYDVDSIDINTAHLLEEKALKSDVVISAVGKPGLITPEILPQGAVVVDAGVADAGGQNKGDLADEVYDRDDLTLTPQKGGVGPLTVCALFENVLLAARRSVGS